MRSFASDYRCKPHPAVLAAVLNACNEDPQNSYGQDALTKETQRTLSLRFGGGITVFFVTNGTAANRLALKTLLNHSFQAVICTDTAHINNAEAGAMESMGHKLLTTPNQEGKIDLDAVASLLKKHKDIHVTEPRVLSISNATELGTVYSFAQLQIIGSFCRHNRLFLHIDGARLSNAAAWYNMKELERITFASGADVVTFGGTKNGGMMGDAVLFADKRLEPIATRYHKQHGQLCARMYPIAAQFAALVQEDLWFQSASHANAMAQELALQWQNTLGLPPVYPVESNAIFLKLPLSAISRLKEETDFYVWDEKEGIIRLMCSWETTSDDIVQLVALIKKCLR